MTDYTKLVAALRICANTAFCNECPLDDTCYNANKLQLDAADAIEALQAQLPKRGKWVRVEDGESYHYECSECGERPLYSRFGDIVLSGVCPMCGAKMEVQG